MDGRGSTGTGTGTEIDPKPWDVVVLDRNDGIRGVGVEKIPVAKGTGESRAYSGLNAQRLPCLACGRRRSADGRREDGILDG